MGNTESPVRKLRGGSIHKLSNVAVGNTLYWAFLEKDYLVVQAYDLDKRMYGSRAVRTFAKNFLGSMNILVIVVNLVEFLFSTYMIRNFVFSCGLTSLKGVGSGSYLNGKLITLIASYLRLLLYSRTKTSMVFGS